jgi:hypothetical protein
VNSRCTNRTFQTERIGHKWQVQYGVALVASLALAACRSSIDQRQESTARASAAQFMKTEMMAYDGEGAWELSQNPDIHFESGFCDVETAFTDGKFRFAHRWMGPSGTLRLRAASAEGKILHLRGIVPTNILRGSAVLEVASRGVALAAFSAPEGSSEIDGECPISLEFVEKHRIGDYVYVAINASIFGDTGDRGCTARSFALKRIFLSEPTAQP